MYLSFICRPSKKLKYATLDDDMAESIREEMVGIPIHKDSTKIENNIFNHTNYCICCKIN